MKKILLTALVAVAALTANAQGYIGGTLGFNSSKTPGATEVTTNRFTIAPEVGYSLDEKWGLGLRLGYTYNKRKSTTAGVSTEGNSSTFNVEPYARYQALTWGKANIFVDGGVNLGVSSAKNMKSGLELGVFITPGIAFNLNEKFSLVARVNRLFGFGYAKQQVPDVAGAPDAPTSFGFGVNDELNERSGILNVGSLTFGVYYNF